MKYSLKYYVDNVFSEAEDSPEMRELHDEVLADMEARYDDCIQSGMTPQRAYAAVIGTMGNIESLLKKSSKPSIKRLFSGRQISEKNIKLIKNTAIAVLWLLCIIFFFLIGFAFDAFHVAWLTFLVGAVATEFIDLAQKIARISKGGDTIENRVKLLRAVEGRGSAILWLMTVILYFGISFEVMPGDFHITWLIFLVSAIIQIIFSAVVKFKINVIRGE